MEEKYITREQTSQLKGIAILLMLWLHLFQNAEKSAGLSSLLYFDHQPLCHSLTRFCGSCVTMFVFMSGYGLWIVHRRGKGLHNGRRIVSLYALVSLVAILFYPWHSLANPNLEWTFGFLDILNNVSGFNPWNCEWWFLFPYVVTMLIALPIFKMVERWPWWTVATGFLVSLASTGVFVYLLHNVWGSELYSTYRVVETLLVVGEFIMPFTIGALCAKTGFLYSLITCAIKYKLLLSGLLIAMLVMQMVVDVSPFNGSIALVFCFVGVTFRSSFLTKLGAVSTEMWLCHTFLCNYYFSYQFYSLRYPLFIFVVLVVVSFLCAHLIKMIFTPIKSLIVKAFDRTVCSEIHKK